MTVLAKALSTAVDSITKLLRDKKQHEAFVGTPIPAEEALLRPYFQLRPQHFWRSTSSNGRSDSFPPAALPCRRGSISLRSFLEFVNQD